MARRELRAGDRSVWAVSDGVLVMSPTMVGIPGNETAGYDEITATYGVARLPVGCFVHRGETTVLVDTGMGPVDFAGKGTLVGGNLVGQLATLGLRPDQIDVLALSHLHGDHSGTVADPRTGEPVFPRATVHVGAADWTHFVSDGNDPGAVADYVRHALEKLDAAGMVVRMDAECDLAAGLRRLPAPGHTPGHSVYVLQDGGERLYLVGDAMHCPQQLAHPDWRVGFDTDPAGAVAVREWLADEAGRPGTVGVLGAHFPELLPVLR